MDVVRTYILTAVMILICLGISGFVWMVSKNMRYTILADILAVFYVISFCLSTFDDNLKQLGILIAWGICPIIVISPIISTKTTIYLSIIIFTMIFMQVPYSIATFVLLLPDQWLRIQCICVNILIFISSFKLTWKFGFLQMLVLTLINVSFLIAMSVYLDLTDVILIPITALFGMVTLLIIIYFKAKRPQLFEIQESIDRMDFITANSQQLSLSMRQSTNFDNRNVSYRNQKLDKIMKDEEAKESFYSFLETKKCKEALEFLEILTNMKTVNDTNEIQVHDINGDHVLENNMLILNFINEDSKNAINVSGTLRNDLKTQLSNDSLTQDVKIRTINDLTNQIYSHICDWASANKELSDRVFYNTNTNTNTTTTSIDNTNDNNVFIVSNSIV